MSTNDRITLNVGGQLFETTKTTLQFSDYFKARMRQSGWNDDKKEVMFIDQSGKIFEHVLSLLRNPDYQYPSKYKSELDFYGVNRNNIEEDRLDHIIKQINALKSSIYQLNKLPNQMIKINKELTKLRENVENEVTCDKCITKEDVEYHYRQTCFYSIAKSDCWNPSLLIKTSSGFVSCNKLKVGDEVVTPGGKNAKIISITHKTMKNKNIANVNGIEITYKHPIFEDGKWCFPKDNYPFELHPEIELFNLKLDRINEVILSNGKYELIVAA